jgi:hypothetical protein
MALATIAALFLIPTVAASASAQQSTSYTSRLVFFVGNHREAGWTVEIITAATGADYFARTNARGSVTVHGTANEVFLFEAWNRKGVECTAGFFTLPPEGAPVYQWVVTC